jgi:L-alanine-DL-glutamate epimerase-like enolase superfamily enzyme
MRISAFRIRRLTFPAGRLIGDNSCTYDQFNLVAVQLTTVDKQTAWGYCTTPSGGTFARPAWFIRPMATAAEMTEAFEEHWWPRLRGADPEIGEELPLAASRFPYLDDAVGNALWDLRAKCRVVPLYQLLAARYGETPRSEVPAYASLLDFPLSHEDAARLARRRARAGFQLVKVKVGAADPGRDLDRLRVLQQAVGTGVQLSGDANEAWSCGQAAETLDFLRRHGCGLAYIEDPLPAADISGFAQLARQTTVPLVAHDYLSTIDEVERFCDTVPLSSVRASSDGVGFLIACCVYAREKDLMVSIGNSFGEIGAHVAAAFPVVRHIEYSGLGWSSLLQDSVHLHHGNVVPHAGPGSGLDPRRGRIETPVSA